MRMVGIGRCCLCGEDVQCVGRADGICRRCIFVASLWIVALLGFFSWAFNR